MAARLSPKQLVEVRILAAPPAKEVAEYPDAVGNMPPVAVWSHRIVVCTLACHARCASSILAGIAVIRKGGWHDLRRRNLEVE
jgi:hypothetical protein